MQSRAARSELSDSLKPKPNGLTIPAPTTTTRALLPFIALDLAIGRPTFSLPIPVAFSREASY
jgi:hypothetical protein